MAPIPRTTRIYWYYVRFHNNLDNQEIRYYIIKQLAESYQNILATDII